MSQAAETAEWGRSHRLWQQHDSPPLLILYLSQFESNWTYESWDFQTILEEIKMLLHGGYLYVSSVLILPAFTCACIYACVLACVHVCVHYRFLDEVQSHSSQNKMSVQNLATVFGPNIFRPKMEDPQIMMEGRYQHIFLCDDTCYEQTNRNILQRGDLLKFKLLFLQYQWEGMQLFKEFKANICHVFLS
jgi:hypothetical protein